MSSLLSPGVRARQCATTEVCSATVGGSGVHSSFLYARTGPCGCHRRVGYGC